MRRTASRLLIAALCFTAGLACAKSPAAVAALGEFFAEPVVEAPAMNLTEGDLRCLEFTEGFDTPSDFKEFWAEFSAALARDDRARLYELTAHERFLWEPGVLSLPPQACWGEHPVGAWGPKSEYVIKSRDSFLKNYERMFTRPFRRAAAGRGPFCNWPGSYIMSFDEGAGDWPEVTVMFVDDGRGFKFAGRWGTFHLPYARQVSDGK